VTPGQRLRRFGFKRAALLGVVVIVAWAPGGVALAMLLSGNAG
jgi:hypothetical protein